MKTAQRVTHLIEKHLFSQRAACRLASIGRSSFRYKARPVDDNALRRRLKELAAKQSVYGYLMLHSLLKTEGLVINKKRTYRVYKEEGLQVRTKKRKKLTRPRQPLERPNGILAKTENRKPKTGYPSHHGHQGHRLVTPK